CAVREHLAEKSGRRPLSRVLLLRPGASPVEPAAIPLGPGLPQGSSHLPAGFGRAGHLPIWCCSGWRLPRFTPRLLRPRTRLCGPLRHVAVPGSYPASRSLEPGLSSVQRNFRHTAAAWPTPGAILRLRSEVTPVFVERRALPFVPAGVAEDRQRQQRLGRGARRR